jgi:hypothetical protein
MQGRLCVKASRAVLDLLHPAQALGRLQQGKLVEMMEEQGVVSQTDHVGKREVPVPER